MTNLASKSRTTCRVCGSARLVKYLDLGATPLANSYLTPAELDQEEFTEELALQLCPECGLSQLTKVVHPDRMFKTYLYASSTPATFREHCAEMAQTTSGKANARPGDLVLDIASNDGCLLSKFKGLGLEVVGVDPAENLVQEANSAGIRTLHAYWSTAVAQDVATRFGRPKIITATNVIAHVDDLQGFVEGIKACLADDGMFVVECPYVVDFIENTEFDTAYHEHLSYVGITPLARLMSRHGLEVFDVEYFADLHGGTIRTYVGRPGAFAITARVGEYLAREDEFGICSSAPYAAFAERVLTNKRQLLDLLNGELRHGKAIWAYGASAKGNTLLNFFGIDRSMVPVALDDNPRKWGFYTPGARMEIAGIDRLTLEVDYLLLLAWNFQKEIVARCRAAGYRGKFIVPVPRPEIVA
jgi:SAM-dependent methyltransferase